MPFIIITFIIILATSGVMALCRKSFVSSLPLALFSMIITGYICAAAGKIIISVWLLRIWLVVCMMLIFKQLYKAVKNKIFPQWDIIVQIMLFTAAMAVLWWLCRGRMFSDWDEFSFWGIAPKFTYYKDMLYTSPLFENGFKSYPPAQIILQYILLKTPMFAFREDILILIPAMLSVSLLIYPAETLFKNKKYLAAVITSVVMCIVPAVIVDHPYYLTTVDMQIGVISAFIIMVFCFEKDEIFRLVTASMAAIVLTLYKSSGIGLAVIASLAGMAVYCFDKKANEKIKVKHLAGLLPLVFAVIAKLSWKLHTAFMGVEERWTAGAQNTLFDVLKGDILSYQSEVVEAFVKEFFVSDSYGNFIKFAPAGWIVISVITAAVTFILVEKNRKKAVVPFIAGIVGYAVFAVSQLYTYMFVFEEFEAVQLASFHRYLSTPILMLLTVSVACFCCTAGNSSRKIVNALVTVMAAALFAISPLTLSFCKDVINAPVLSAQTQHDRYLYIRTSKYIKQLGAGEDTRLFLVSANDAGWTQMLVEYELFPEVILPEQVSIIAAGKMEDQPWVEQMSAEEWSKLLYNEYDYVYIHCPEDQFVADYLSVFEDESQVVVDRMFEVIKTENGTAKLRRIEMQPEDGYIN